MLINYDAKVLVGIEAFQDHRKRKKNPITQAYFKIQEGRRQPELETGPTHSPETFCLKAIMMHVF